MRKKLALIIVAAALLFSTQNAQAGWTSQRLTWNSGDSKNPSIVVDSGKNVHIVWNDNTLGNNEVFYKKSTNGGSIWTTKRLTWNSGNSLYPAIATNASNHIHIVWSDNTPGNYEIYYKKSTDGGSTWITKRLTWNSGNSRVPAIVVDSNSFIHVVWYDDTPGNTEIYYKRSTDGGSTWMTKRLTWNSGGSDCPSITASSSGNVYVVWRDYSSGNEEIYFKQSTDGGITWMTKRLTWNSSRSISPDIAIDSGNAIHVVWYDDMPGNYEIYYKKSADGGLSWSTKRLTWGNNFCESPAVTTDSSNAIHVVWMEYKPSNWNIFYKQSSDGGTNWSTTRMSWGSGASVTPNITIDKDKTIHIVWSKYSLGNWEIIYKKSS